MLYAVLSDIHGNPWALEKALADAQAQGVEKYIYLGDIVGYGPDAVGAVKLVRETFDVALIGNHDAATAGLISSWDFRPEARDGVRRHGLELSGEDLTWLKGRPYVHRSRTYLAAHGSIVRPKDFPYITSVEMALEAFRGMGMHSLLFVGHTHSSLWVEQEGAEVRAERSDELTLTAGMRYIVNVGSVGYPRNECESVYALYDSRRRVIVWRRLSFDYANYFARMEEKNIRIMPWLRENAQEAIGRVGTPCRPHG